MEMALLIFMSMIKVAYILGEFHTRGRGTLEVYLRKKQSHALLSMVEDRGEQSVKLFVEFGLRRKKQLVDILGEAQ